MTILCKGEKLTGAGDVTLKECGVEDGGVVNVVPKKKKTSVKKEKVAAVVEGDGKTGVGGGGGGGVGFAGMGDLIKGFTGGEEVEGGRTPRASGRRSGRRRSVAGSRQTST